MENIGRPGSSAVTPYSKPSAGLTLSAAATPLPAPDGARWVEAWDQWEGTQQGRQTCCCFLNASRLKHGHLRLHAEREEVAESHC